MFDIAGIRQPLWNGFTLRQINDLHRRAVQRVGEQQYFKIRALNVFLRPGFSDGYTAVCFKVNAQMVHGVLLPFVV